MSIGARLARLTLCVALLGATAALALPTSVADAALPTSVADAATLSVRGTSVLSASQVQAQQWWITRLDLRKIWKITRGKGVTVAVIDTGVDRTFGDLRGAVRGGFTAGESSGSAAKDSDPALHGTRIADEIAGRGTGFGLLGVAPQSTILPVRVDDRRSEDPIIEALRRLTAMAHPPQVVNMSFGGPFACSSELAAATRNAVAAGMVLLASAGNSNQDGNLSEYPANCPGVVAVGAIGNNAAVWSQSQRRSYVVVSGPGVHMIGYDSSARSGYGYADGTSDASATVAGVVALIRAHFPSMSGRDVVTRLLATARQFQGKQGTRNDAYGFGVALPRKALTDKVAANAPNPVYAALRSGGSTTKPSTTPSTAVPSTSTPATTSPPNSASPSDTGTQPVSQASSSSGGTSPGIIIAIVAAIVVVLAIVIGVVLRSRRRAVATNRGFGPPPGGYGPPPGGYGPRSGG